MDCVLSKSPVWAEGSGRTLQVTALQKRGALPLTPIRQARPVFRGGRSCDAQSGVSCPYGLPAAATAARAVPKTLQPPG